MHEVKTYWIPADKLPVARRRVDRATKQARSLGSDWTPTLESSDPVWAPNKTGDGGMMRRKLTITIPPLSLSESWRVIATASIINPGKGKRTADEAREDHEHVIVRAAHGIEPPADSWNVGNTCDHCGWVRYRHTVYILECTSEVDGHEVGDVVRVGASCVDKFVGTDLGLIRAMEAIVRWAEETSEKTLAGLYREKTVYPIVEEVIAVLESFRQYPCADDMSRRARYNHVERQCYVTRRETRQLYAYPVPADTWETAHVICDWIQDGMKVNSKFTRNLHSLFTAYALTSQEMRRRVPLIIAGVLHYTGSMTPKPEAEPEAPQRNLRSGDSVEVTGDLIRVRHGVGEWGPWHLYVVRSNGVDYAWFASRDQQMTAGVPVRLAGKVKFRKDYKNREGYTLTRCTLRVAAAA